MNRSLLALVLVIGTTALALPSCVAGQTASPAEAEELLRSGSYEEAIAAFSAQLEERPADVAAARGLVRALTEVGRYEEAESAARDGMQAGAGHELGNALGQVLHQRGRLEEAEEAFRAAVDGGAADRLTARVNLAALRYERIGRDEAMPLFDEFIDVYNRGEATSSADLTAVGRAVSYLGEDDPELLQDALMAFDEAVAADPDDPEPHLLLGELFLSKYNSPDARASFDAVLSANPSNPQALLGLARVHAFEDSPEAESLARQALEVNPNLVGARLLLARDAFARDDPEETLAEAERALAVNPASTEAIAVAAAARHLDGEDELLDALGGVVPEGATRGARLYTTLAELAAQRRRYAQAAELAQEAVELDPDSWPAHGELGLNLLRLGRVEEARASLETAFAGDPYNVWFKNTLDLLDTFGEYQEVEAGPFLLALHGDEADVLAPYVAPLAAEAYDQLTERYGHEPPTPIRVEFYPRHADFSVRTVGLTGLGALGVSFGPVVAVGSPSGASPGELNWAAVLWHELAHSVHLSLSEGRVPRWLTEGMAVLEERRAASGWGRGREPAFLAAYARDEIRALEDLPDAFVRPRSPAELNIAYFHASLVAELIEQEHGMDALLQLLRGYAAGRTTDQVFRDVLGSDPAALDARFHDFVRERYASPLAALRALPDPGELDGPPSSRAALEDRVDRNPDDFRAHLGLGRVLLDADELEAAAEHLEQARALYPGYPGDDSPDWFLAQIHRRQGDARAAADALDRLTSVNERHYEANLTQAELLEEVGDTAGAADALERAIRIYPYEIALHTRLAELFAALERWSDVVRERQVVLALEPVNVAEALYHLAEAQLRAGDATSARRTVLRALETAPNYREAQELLLEIRGETAASSGGSGASALYSGGLESAFSRRDAEMAETQGQVRRRGV